MAIKNKVDLIADADSFIPDNITEDISPGDVRDRIKDLASSNLNIVDGGFVVQALTGYASALTPSDDKHFANKKYVDDAIAGLTTGLTYQGTWNANTNTPALASGVGTNGYYYIVNVSGTTNLDGITDWQVGDWALFNGTAWQKIDQSTDWTEGYPTYDLRYQGLATNLTSLSSLSYASTSFVKMTAAGTFALDTNTYASASDLTSYAKLDGTNMPFTGNVTINKTDSRLNLYAANSGTSTAKIIFYDNSSNEVLNIGKASGLVADAYGQFGLDLRGSSNQVQIRSNAINNIVSSSKTILNSSEFSIYNTFAYIRDTAGTIFSTFRTAANQNNLVLAHSLKIGNTTQTAAAAGAGSIRYNSGGQISDGSNWEQIATSDTTATKVTAAAPYTNDGYIELRINGTLYKLMTTA